MRSPRLVHGPPEDIPIHEVAGLREAVPRVCAQRHREYAVQFLECLFLGLGHKEQHQEKADNIPGCVPSKGTLGLKSLLHGWPGHREDEVEEPGRCCGEGHADGSDVEWVGLGGIGKRHRAFAGGVDHAEQVDAKSDAANSCL